MNGNPIVLHGLLEHLMGRANKIQIENAKELESQSSVVGRSSAPEMK